MTERHLHDDPPTAEQVAAASADVRAALDTAAETVPIGRTRTLVGLAGSVTTVTAHALRLDSYRADVIHRSVLPVDQVRAACDDLLARTREQRAALPYMHPGRVDVIGAGALVWRLVVDRVAADAGITEVVTSEHDILDGIAYSVAS
jgi:exopolyphosphatase/guanosine-5'-triphosphate,3'-diphosphate pyrophosphatase